MRIKRAVLFVSFVLCSLAPLAIADPGDGATVIGGQPVPDGVFPDAVAILGPGGRCSGTLVAPDVVVTAGHCIEIEPTVVVVNAVDLGDGGGEWIDVEWAEAYPDWHTSYDVGVVVLAHGARTRPSKVARTCTATAQLWRGIELTLVGFGQTTTSLDDPDPGAVKHAATIAITDPACVTDDSCHASVRPGGEFIAGGGGADSCYGDSGGGAYAAAPDGPVLLGVVSRGLAGAWECGNGGVYVRADRIARWIERVTGRRLGRPSCTGPADDPGDDGVDDRTGCSAGGSGAGGLAALIVLLLAALVRPGRRAPA